MCKLVAGVWSVNVFNNGETPGWSVGQTHNRVVIGPKEYCKLENKFWNASKKNPTSAKSVVLEKKTAT